MIVLQMGRKHLGEKEKLLVTSNFSLPTVFSKDLYCRHVKIRACLEPFLLLIPTDKGQSSIMDTILAIQIQVFIKTKQDHCMQVPTLGCLVFDRWYKVLVKKGA